MAYGYPQYYPQIPYYISQTHGKFLVISRCASAYGIAVDGRKYATGEENMPVFDKKFVVKMLVEKVKELPKDLQAEFFAWMERKILAERMSCKTHKIRKREEK